MEPIKPQGFFGRFFGKKQTAAPPTSVETIPVVPTDMPADIVHLVREGKKIEAVKRYREIHDCDLLTAKNAIDAV